MLTLFFRPIEAITDLEKRYRMNAWLHKSASIKPRANLPKLGLATYPRPSLESLRQRNNENVRPRAFGKPLPVGAEVCMAARPEVGGTPSTRRGAVAVGVEFIPGQLKRFDWRIRIANEVHVHRGFGEPV